MNVASETNIDAFGDLELAVGHLLDTVTVWYGVRMCEDCSWSLFSQQM